MPPAGIQDESSEHEHQKEYDVTMVSEYSDGEHVATVVRGGELFTRWHQSNAMTGDPLSDAIVEKLTDLFKRMSLAVVSFGKCIRAAENSQYCIRELSQKKWTLEFWTGCVEGFISNNKHDDVKVDILDSMHGLLEDVGRKMIDVRRKLNIKYGEFDESEWWPPMCNQMLYHR